MAQKAAIIIDGGGHRFFSKSDRVMRFWLEMLPRRAAPAGESVITHQEQCRPVFADSSGHDSRVEDKVMLLQGRLSRINFLCKLFSYPITLGCPPSPRSR